MSEYDIIFAGGGTTACVAAGRLAAADPSLKILIVERGQHSHDLPIHVQPCRFVENLAANSTTVTRHQAKKTPYLDAATVVPSGRCIGGGSAVNFMVYVRGAQSDYDGWEALGNKGWGFKDVLSLFQKLETFTPVPNLPTHGYDGPVQVSGGGTNREVGRSFLAIAEKYDPQRPVVLDINDFKTSNGYSTYYKYINADDGKRSDAASRYLYPHYYNNDNKNLEILVGRHVERVIFDEDKHAVGIQYTEEGTGGTPVTARARKLVVLSAGAFGSPTILERSGIGAKSILENNDVHPIVDLPGVGEEYHDHPSAILVNYAADETETLDDVWRDPKAIDQYVRIWETTGKGKIAANGIDAIVKWRPTEEDLRALGADFKPYWDSFYKDNTDKPIGMLASVAGLPRAGSTETRKFITMAYNTLYPEGVGSVHIKPGNTEQDRLDFDPGFLSKPSDVALFTWMYKKSRELGRRLPSYRGEVPGYHPKFPDGSPASAKETDMPVPFDAPDIEYTKEDDAAIIAFHRATVQTTWHSLGTCAMKPQEQRGVVDEKLNVYGVKGLKVADLSICPGNVGNNTNSTALMIGEKTATIISAELGITLE